MTGCVRLLLEAGAAVEQPMANGLTAFFCACSRGNMPIVQMLSASGATRSVRRGGEVLGLEILLPLVERGDPGVREVVEWLDESRGWTPLHHVAVLTPARATALLRGGACPHALAPVAPPTGLARTPLQLARGLAAQSSLDGSAAAVLDVLERAAAPWSSANHDLLPAKARARAQELLVLGYRLALQPRFDGCAHAIVDVWKSSVIPQALAAFCADE